jgi:hypothetical protein
LDHPAAVTTWPGNADVLVIAERGTMRVVREVLVKGQPNPKSIVVDLVGKARFPGAGAACVDLYGLTGVAFHPEFLNGGSKRLIYVRYNADDPASTSGGTLTRVEEYTIPPGTLAADPSTARTILETPDTAGHVVGQLAFEKPAPGAGPARLLVPTGDNTGAFGALQSGGGAAATGDCTVAVGTQVPGELIGRLLAIDVDATTSPPPISVLAQGFRNPWGIGVDSGSPQGNGRNDVWIGDTGDLTSGNVMRVVPTGPVPNFGWPCFEFDDDLAAHGATITWSAADCATELECSSGITQPDRPVHALQKLALYGDPTSSQRDALIGGFVYRGTNLSTLDGRYPFGTFGMGSAGPPWMPKLMSVDATTPNTQPMGELGTAVGGAGGIQGVPGGMRLVGISADSDGEPLLLLHNCGNGNGRVYRVVP